MKTKDGTVSELEALVLRLREQGALQISVSKGDTAITATFAPVMPRSQIPEVEDKKAEPVKDEEDLAYWSSSN